MAVRFKSDPSYQRVGKQVVYEPVYEPVASEAAGFSGASAVEPAADVDPSPAAYSDALGAEIERHEEKRRQAAYDEVPFRPEEHTGTQVPASMGGYASRFRGPSHGGHGLKTHTQFYSQRDTDMKGLIFGAYASPKGDEVRRPHKVDDDYLTRQLQAQLRDERAGVAAKIGGFLPPEDTDNNFQARRAHAELNKRRGAPLGAAPFARDSDDDLYKKAKEDAASVAPIGAGGAPFEEPGSPPRHTGRGRDYMPHVKADVVTHHATGDVFKDKDIAEFTDKVGTVPIVEDPSEKAKRIAENRALVAVGREGHGPLWDPEKVSGTKDRDMASVVAKVTMLQAAADKMSIRNLRARNEANKRMLGVQRGGSLWDPDLVSGEKDRDLKGLARKVTADALHTLATEDPKVRDDRLATARMAQVRNRGSGLW